MSLRGRIICISDHFSYWNSPSAPGSFPADGGSISRTGIHRKGIHKNVFTGNTTIGFLITNADLTKDQCNKLADMAHDGYARAIKPVHTSADGDTIFFLAKGNVIANGVSAQLDESLVVIQMIFALKRNERKFFSHLQSLSCL